MLDKMDEDRPTALRDRDAALDAQQIGSAQRQQHRHGLFESRPAERLFEDQREAGEPELKAAARRSRLAEQR
jgi:hypothetical protein